MYRLPRVLVVDDDPDTTFTTVEILRRAGFAVTETSRPRQVITLMRQFNPNVVLLDVSMPLINGCDIARQIRCDPMLSFVQLIAVSGYEFTDEMRNAGFDRHLLKPVAPERLLRVLANL